MTKEQLDDNQLSLIEYYQTKSPRVKNRIAKNNVGLVVSEFNKLYVKCQFLLTADEKEDLLQQGFFGLAKSIEGYDPSTRHKFSSYAVPKIRGAMQQYLRDKVSLIRIPQKQQEALSKKDETIVHSKKNNSPTLLSKKARKITLDELRKEVGQAIYCHSLEYPLSEESNSTLKDIIEDTNIRSDDDYSILLDIDTCLLSKQSQAVFSGVNRLIDFVLNKKKEVKSVDVVQLGLFE